MKGQCWSFVATIELLLLLLLLKRPNINCAKVSLARRLLRMGTLKAPCVVSELRHPERTCFTAGWMFYS